jgi:hypothetical protein
MENYLRNISEDIYNKTYINIYIYIIYIYNKIYKKINICISSHRIKFD